MRTRLHHLVAEAADLHGHANALTYKNVTVTYAEFWSDVRGFGAALGRLGLRRNDRVAVYLDKRPETVVAVFGTSAASGIFVPVNPLLKPRQVGYIMRDCDVRVLVTSPDRFALLRSELADCTSLEHVILTSDDHAGIAAASDERYAVLPWPRSKSGELVSPENSIDADIAAVFYTSGSTGLPKGVVLSHRNLIVGAESVSHYIGNRPDDVILSALPLSFDAGFSQLTTAFSVGAHVVLLNYLLPGEVVRLCAKHHVTGLTCVPPLWIQLAAREWPAEASEHLRYFANTGGKMPKTTLDKLRSLFPGAAPYLMYGLTEAFRSTYLDPAEVDRRPDSIGKAIPNAEILVVRPDGSLCDVGEEGELVHRGALVSLGYWNDPERTAERFRPAPLRESGLCTNEIAVWSGDVVVRDDKGFLYFVGRKDEMIKTSGYRVSPSEVEDAAYSTGMVRDAVALGLEDPALGQQIVLVVSAAKPEEFQVDALSLRLKKMLPNYMAPKLIYEKPELPRSPNGKFDRALLRAELTT